MRRLLSFSLLFSCYLVGKLFYRLEVNWVDSQEPDFDDIRLLIFLNHTSLFEPLFAAAFPLATLWKASRDFVAPGADKTLKRPIVGRFYKWFAPNMISISRKRDETWRHFMQMIRSGSMVIIAAEGRMLRPNGLDSHGKPMSIRGGVADILKVLDSGKILIAYSGGLHHVQKPGEWRFNIFQKIRLNFETLDLVTYKQQFDSKHFIKQVVDDLESRKKRYCPLAT